MKELKFLLAVWQANLQSVMEYRVSFLTQVIGMMLNDFMYFAIWIVFYVAGVIGAGDVKFFAAAGAWLGPSATWRAALIAGVAGGVLAVFFLLRDRRLGKTLQQMMLAASSGSVAMLGQGVDHQGSRRRGIPYGVALAFGALSAAWLPRLLGGG